MAPEVLRNQGYSCASDVWSVGTIAYLLLTNHFPFDDGAPFSSYSFARFNKPLLPPSSYNESVDPALDRIILATLEVDQANRLTTARVLADALRERQEVVSRRPALQSGYSVTKPPTERAQRLADEALALSHIPGELDRAADLMEEAVNLSPHLREMHLPKLLLWRRGVVM
jgi:serine/threonine-protein kinase